MNNERINNILNSIITMSILTNEQFVCLINDNTIDKVYNKYDKDVKIDDVIINYANKIVKQLIYDNTYCTNMNKKFMIKYTDNTNNDIQNIKSSLKQIENNLRICKEKVDQYYTGNINNTNIISSSVISETFNTLINILDPFRSFKYHIINNLKGQEVSPIWFKYWEIISEFKLIPTHMNERTYIVFDYTNNSSGISTINHYIKEETFIKSFIWYCNSNLLDKENKIEKVENIDNKLIKNYKSRFLNINDYMNKNVDLELDLFISNEGISLHNYNNQELEFLPIIKQQLLLATNQLRLDGNMVLKCYTFFSEEMIDILYRCYNSFEQLYIYKPVTSKITNSECFIIGIGYKHNNDTNLKTDIIPDWFYAQINYISNNLWNDQIKSLDYIMNLYDMIINHIEYDDNINNSNLKEQLLTIICKYMIANSKTYNCNITNSWLKSYPIHQLKLKNKLRL